VQKSTQRTRRVVTNERYLARTESVSVTACELRVATEAEWGPATLYYYSTSNYWDRKLFPDPCPFPHLFPTTLKKGAP
jgi:hypothetical protein